MATAAAMAATAGAAYSTLEEMLAMADMPLERGSSDAGGATAVWEPARDDGDAVTVAVVADSAAAASDVPEPCAVDGGGMATGGP